MKSALNFLIAARRCEIDELEQLARTGELVGAIARLVHALQKERGLSNLFLASQGARGGDARQRQAEDCDRLARAVQDDFEPLAQGMPRQPGSGARLFSRIACVLPGLAALPALRARIGALALAPHDAAAAFGRLIAGLLAVVFEAADGATDPEVSRLLAALFHLMQGKELSGQERACGTAAFASGRIDEPQRRQWLDLIAAQERCLALCAAFRDADIDALRQPGPDAQAPAELERLRRIGCASPAGTPLDTELSGPWFRCCSTRIDVLKTLEDEMAALLQARCAAKIAQARQECTQLQALTRQFDRARGEPAGLPAEAAGFLERAAAGLPVDWPASLGHPPGGAMDPLQTLPYGHQLARSILDTLQAQSRRLQAMQDELAAVRAALHERKLVERAKGLLMAHRHLGEADAHRLLRETAMHQSRRLVEVAESVLAMAELLPAAAPGGGPGPP